MIVLPGTGDDLTAKFWISCSFFILVEEVFDHTVEQ